MGGECQEDRMVRQRDRRGVECGQVWYPHIAATDGMEEHPRDATSISTWSKSFALHFRFSVSRRRWHELSVMDRNHATITASFGA